MLGNMLRVLRLLSIIGVIVPIRTAGQTLSNGYNDRDVTSGLEWILRFGQTFVNLVNQTQSYLAEEVSDTTPQSAATYDFIVIGAGSAGAAIAARLSEIRQVNILLIEAGTNEKFGMDVPMLVSFLQLSNEINWKYRTKPSKKYCLGMKNNSCNWPRGKVMGGSSVLNFMIASRGGAEDYDRWAELGNEGWAYKDVLEYFKKLETIAVPELRADNVYHNTNGPVHISIPTFHTPLAKAFLKAGEELGYPLVDYNGKDMIGFSYLQTTIKNGTRISSNTAYLHPIHDRKNFHVSQKSLVKRVLIDRHKKQAIGVEFIKNGRTISVFANKEVILCAGAIGSPQLLMLSGIGPAEHLAKLGINVVKDAPVGENLMDHIAFGGLNFAVNAPATLHWVDIVNPIQPHITEFLTRRKGILEVPGGCEALAFINTKHPEKRDGLPDVELLFIGGSFKGDLIQPVTMGLNNPLSQIWDKHIGEYGWTMLPMILKPKSRGRIRLLANDINVKPEIIPNYFSDPEDVKTMIAAIKTGMRVAQTKALQAFGSRFMNDTLPGCEDYEYDSDVYWECTMRTIPFTIYHYSGTCKMAPRTDPTAVVDPKLKVIGVQGLRVADASIMPEIISAHTNIPVYMIAEKLADMVKEEWGYS